MIEKIKKTLEAIEEKLTYPDVYTIEGAPTNPEIVIDGKKILIFCSNNYLGTAADPRVKKSVIEAVEIYGMGSGGSRLVSGNTAVQEKLEAKIAEFKETEDAITFTTGYMANTGVIPALLNPPVLSKLEYFKRKIFFAEKAVVFSDELNHASIVDGIKLSKAEKVIFKHCDMLDLEKKLKRKRRFGRKLIITDGVFSMDGDIAPLDRIVYLAKKYNAIVMVDDAHATGILGDKGKGSLDYFKIPHDERVVVMGTFTKVFGGIGGFIAGPRDLIKYLRVTARTYIFSAPVPPAIASGIITAIDVVASEPDRRIKLWYNINYMKNRLAEHNFNFLKSDTQIIPIYIGDEKKAIQASRKLLEYGIFASCIRWPAVAQGASRLRVTVISSHTKEHMDAFIEALIRVRNEIHF